MADDTGAAPASSGAADSSSASTAPVSVSTPAPATAAPETTSATPTPGEPPRERWADILEHTRTKTRSDAEAEWRGKYGWVDEFERTPVEYVETWLDQLAAHPQHQQRIYAKAARLLQSRRGHVQPVSNEEPPPDVPITDANGNITGQTYSATQLKKWRDWEWTQREAQLNERLQPLEQRNQRQQHQEFLTQIRQQSDAYAVSTLTELRQDPYFKEHEPKVKQALASHPEWGDNVYRAYQHVLQTEIHPQFMRTAEGRVLDTLKTQAAGGTVNPSQSAPNGVPKFKDFGEALRYYDAHPDAAAAMAKGR